MNKDYVELTFQQFMGISNIILETIEKQYKGKMPPTKDFKKIKIRIHDPIDNGNVNVDIGKES